MSAPIRHPAPTGELRLEYPGQCWVWACSDREWPRAFQALYWSVDGEDVTFANGYPHGWFAFRTRGPNPPWPHFLSQRDPGDETPEADGWITYTGPSEGFDRMGARG